jgi:putative transposase
MRYPVSEKLEIIRLVERSHLPVRRTLDKLGIPATTFYRWYDRYRAFGQAGLEDRTSGPGRVWNRIADDVRRQIVDLALDEPELSPRELAVTFIDTKGYFVSEASVYRLLKAHDLITSPAFVVIKAADAFQDPTTAPNQLWQTDFTYLKVVGWGWFYLSTILDDYSRYIIAWKLCTTMRADDVTETSSWPCRHRAATGSRSSTSQGCSAITARPTSPATSPIGSSTRGWLTSAAHRTIRRPRARSSVGTRP